MNITKNIGMILLSIYMLITGVIILAGGLGIPPVVMGLLALATGLFILIGK